MQMFKKTIGSAIEILGTISTLLISFKHMTCHVTFLVFRLEICRMPIAEIHHSLTGAACLMHASLRSTIGCFGICCHESL